MKISQLCMEFRSSPFEDYRQCGDFVRQCGDFVWLATYPQQLMPILLHLHRMQSAVWNWDPTKISTGTVALPLVTL